MQVFIVPLHWHLIIVEVCASFYCPFIVTFGRLIVSEPDLAQSVTAGGAGKDEIKGRTGILIFTKFKSRNFIQFAVYSK